MLYYQLRAYFSRLLEDCVPCDRTVRTTLGGGSRITQIGSPSNVVCSSRPTAIPYHEAELRAHRLAEATVRTHRSGINLWVRHLDEFGHLDPERARLVLARRLPPGPIGERERPSSY